jgi:DNA-binding NarL/FixJ family response regulator
MGEGVIAPAGAEAVATPGDPPLPPVRVLVVDDHALVRDALMHMLRLTPSLQPAGEAGESGEAIALARRLQPDVALVDLSLAPGDGIETAREIVAASPGTRVIILTDAENEDTLMRALRVGVRGYVLKTLPFAGLVHSIERVMAGEFALPRNLATRVVVRLGSDQQRSAVSRLTETLTEREREILRCLVDGETNRQIAARLVISEHTVRAHMRSLMQKLGVANRAQAAALAATCLN